MGINAGAYLDGVSMDDLGTQTLDLTINVASGQRCAGERKATPKCRIRRIGGTTDAGQLAELLNQPLPDGASLPVLPPDQANPQVALPTFTANGTQTLDRVALVLPTVFAPDSDPLGSPPAQPTAIGRDQGISRFVTLVHTEGCGVSGGTSEDLYIRTMMATSPTPSGALPLARARLRKDPQRLHAQPIARVVGYDLDRLGFASVQLDSGIENVLGKISMWFDDTLANEPKPTTGEAGLDVLRVGLAVPVRFRTRPPQPYSKLTRQVVAAGGASRRAAECGILSSPAYLTATLGNQPVLPTLAYGAPMRPGACM